MSIKYLNGDRYGERWNPDLDYGNEYVCVHFRINAKGYEYLSFRFTEEEKIAFDKELVEIFTSLGWECKERELYGACQTWHNEKSHLYLHPQDFSGEVLKNDIKAIAKALENNSTFVLRWVDLYETVFDMTDEEYEMILSKKDEEIRNTVLEVCKTTRSNKFCYANDVVRVLSEKFRVRRIGEEDGRTYGIGQSGRHIAGIIHMLENMGYLVSARKGELIRTINKTEQKKKKLYID